MIKHNKTLQARSIVVYCMRIPRSQSKNVSICTRCRNGEGKTNLADREKKGVFLDKSQRLVNIKMAETAANYSKKAFPKGDINQL